LDIFDFHHCLTFDVEYILFISASIKELLRCARIHCEATPLHLELVHHLETSVESGVKPLLTSPWRPGLLVPGSK